MQCSRVHFAPEGLLSVRKVGMPNLAGNHLSLKHHRAPSRLTPGRQEHRAGLARRVVDLPRDLTRGIDGVGAC